ncbi:hypothetical protein EW145_g4659 [Phellinidium pouzarii]|uniref:AAA+ ATPase domain-containing protein n=1 Tax=Phellinidium pouzarii TaxID=167371 RepID=A0A4S4L2W3_9AGAM|nr:hypothetical protein EW145_g4659 [Phellinidium pouzarii]
MNTLAPIRLAQFNHAQRFLRPGSSRIRARFIYRCREYSIESATTDASRKNDSHFDAVMSSKADPAVNNFAEHSRFTPRSQYRKLVRSGALRKDDYQEQIVGKLQTLHNLLKDYDQPPVPEEKQTSFLLSRFFSKPEPQSLNSAVDVPRGLYLYGDVGTGKSMLMDMFYDTLPPHIKKKRRVHFHAFMIDVHKRVHAVKSLLGTSGGDPIEPVAKDLAREVTVLCFDEFQVTDIVDAMIIRRLLETLLKNGVVFVMTSNRHPDELYKNGIQRSSFIPCIELLKSELEIINLDSETDYRRIPRALSNVYFHPLTHENKGEINKVFSALATKDGEDISYSRHLDIWGRKLHVPESSSHVARFTFDELCGHPLSAADYLEVTKTFHTVFITDIPKMNMGQKDKARRFITFIDACYESRTKLFTTSEVPIFQIFSDDNGNGQSISDHQRSVMDDLGLSDSTIGTSSMFTGEEEVFAFARCCSRLVQMGSKEWAETAGQE